MVDENYPKEERNKIVMLVISKKNLYGFLKLDGFVNLEYLDCSNNQLANLHLSSCLGVTFLDCKDNFLTNLEFLKGLDHEKVEYL